MEKGPFSLYDFMGYFFPGALSLYLIILSQNDIGSYFSKDFFLNVNKKFIELPLYMILFYVIISYCLGHFLSFFSTLTIEKYTRILYDDPSKILISDKPFQQKSLKELKINFFRFIIFLLIWPLILSDLFIVRIAKFDHSYLRNIDEPYNSLIKKRINKVFENIGYEGDIFENSKNNFHQFLIHYNYEFTKYHGHKLMNYVSLYGFLRVITLISSLFLNYVLINYINTHKIQLDFQGVCNFMLFLCCLLSCGLITFVFYLGYLKFYKRYTLENLMLVLIVDNEQKH